MKSKKLSPVIFLFFVYSSQGRAQEIETFTPNQDTYVTSELPNDCWHNEPLVYVGEHTQIIGLMRFGVSSIPAGSIVESATLKLLCAGSFDPGYMVVGRPDSYWTIAGSSCVKWTTRPNPGGSPTSVYNGSFPYLNWIEIDVTDIVERWVTFEESNYGFYFEMSSGMASFYSDNNVYSSKPKLVVEYTPNNCSASGKVTTQVGYGILNVQMHFTRVSGSGSIPGDDYSSVLGEWEQNGFEQGTTYRVTPSKSDCGQWTFNPTYRDFSCSNGNVIDLDFTGTPPTVGTPVVSAVSGPEFDQITISWSHICGAISYIIEYDDDFTEPWDPYPNGNPISGTDVGYVNEVTISSLRTGQEYILRVAAYNEGGLGAWSTPVYELPREPLVVQFTPPFSGAIYEHSSEEIDGIMERKYGAVESEYAPSTGIIHHKSSIALMGFGGTVYKAIDKGKWTFAAPANGTYRITVDGHVSGNILAAGDGVIYDMKHQVLVGIGVEGGINYHDYDVYLPWNTLPEELTYGIPQLAEAGVDALIALLCTGVSGGVCGISGAVLTAYQIAQLYENISDFAEAFIGFDKDVSFEVEVDLSSTQDNVFEFFVWGTQKGGVSVAYEASVIDVQFEIERITCTQLSGDVGPVLHVSPIDPVIFPNATVTVPVNYPSTFTVTNAGDQTLVGNASSGSGLFQITSSLNYNLAPGESTTIDMQFFSNTAGSFIEEVQFTGGGGATRSVQCTAVEADPELAIYPDVVDFGHVESGDEILLNAFSVGNSGGGTLTGQASVDPPFYVVSGSPYTLDNGASSIIRIAFRPDSPGTFSREITFSGPTRMSTTSKTLIGLSCANITGPDPTFLSPQNGSSGGLEVTFIWEEVIGATSYLIRIDTLQPGSQYQWRLDTIFDTTTTVTLLQSLPQAVYWQVKALGSPPCTDGVWTSPALYTDIEEILSMSLPHAYALHQNYPNPFNPETRIEFSIPKRSFVTIEVFNVLGARVRQLVNGQLSAGYKVVTWDGQDDNGISVSSGVYLYRIVAGDFVENKKMMLLK